MKNKIMLRRREINEDEQLIPTSTEKKSGNIDKVYYTIRGIDFDPKSKMLYTGDEMGYM